MELVQLMTELNAWMNPSAYKDYCPNGLQIEGCARIERIICGVTASESLIDHAIAHKAQAILVHHGYFWRGEAPVITGQKARRLKKIMQHDLSLIAYHLPLDVHPVLGNNATLANRLRFTVEGQVSAGDTPGLLWFGRLHEPMSSEQLTAHISCLLGRRPLLLGDSGSRLLRTIAWCTGGAQGYIDQAIGLGVDVYLSGEASEQTFHSAVESGIVYVGAGHHATERFGVQALGAKIQESSGIAVEYFEIDNPV